MTKFLFSARQSETFSATIFRMKPQYSMKKVHHGLTVELNHE